MDQIALKRKTIEALKVEREKKQKEYKELESIKKITPLLKEENDLMKEVLDLNSKIESLKEEKRIYDGFIEERNRLLSEMPNSIEKLVSCTRAPLEQQDNEDADTEEEQPETSSDNSDPIESGFTKEQKKLYSEAPLILKNTFEILKEHLPFEIFVEEQNSIKGLVRYLSLRKQNRAAASWITLDFHAEYPLNSGLIWKNITSVTKQMYLDKLLIEGKIGSISIDNRGEPKPATLRLLYINKERGIPKNLTTSLLTESIKTGKLEVTKTDESLPIRVSGIENSEKIPFKNKTQMSYRCNIGVAHLLNLFPEKKENLIKGYEVYKKRKECMQGYEKKREEKTEKIR